MNHNTGIGPVQLHRPEEFSIGFFPPPINPYAFRIPRTCCLCFHARLTSKTGKSHRGIGYPWRAGDVTGCRPCGRFER